MQTAKDFGYRNQKTYQLARTLAAIVHTMTLSRPGLAHSPSIAIRRSSKSLTQEIILAYSRRVKGESAAQLFARAEMITNEILALIQSPRLFPSGAVKDQAYLLNSYRSLLESFRRGESEEITNSPAHPAQNAAPASRASDSLEGRVILITRSTSQSHSIVEEISSLGAIPVVIPMIEFVDPDSWEAVDAAIINLPGYEGVVFTSQNAVERFLHRADAVNKSAKGVLASRQVSAVGEKTRTALEKAGIPVTLMPDRFSSKDLVAKLQQSSVRGKRYLFPKGDLARGEVADALRGCDAVVDEVVVYNTVKPVDQELEPLKQGLRNGDIDAITFFSPSSVQNFLRSITPDFVGNTVVGCIGQSTGAEARAAGFESIVTAKEATVESLISALTDHFEAHPTHHTAKGSNEGE